MKKVLIFLCLSFPVFSSVKLRLSHSDIELKVYPGAIKSFSFSVTNLLNAPCSCRLYTSDIDLTPEGEILYLPVGSASFSCARWIKFSQDKLTLKGKETKEIHAQAIIPRDADGCYTGIIFCETLPPKLELDKDQAGVAVRLRLAIYLDMKVGKKLYERVSMSNIEFLKKEREFLVVVENKGNNSCLTKPGSLTIKAKGGGVVKKLPLLSNRYTLFRNSSRIFRARMDDILLQGEYKLEAFIPYKEKHKVVKSCKIKAEKGNIVFLELEEKEEGVSLEIEPALLSLYIPPGGFRAGIIKISNKENVPVSFSLGMRDIDYKEGNIELLPLASSTTYSIKPFVEIFPTSLRLEPKGVGILRYKMFVPKEEKGGRYGAGSILAITSDGKREDFTLHIELVIQKTEERLLKIEDIKPVSLKKLSFLLKNGGNVLEKGTSATLLIKDNRGKILHDVPFITPFVFPKQDKGVIVEHPLLSRGIYLMEIKIGGIGTETKVYEGL
ncbi:TPA: hypothetical protein DCX16_06645 [bacterium]|nr:hypothetical protein [bacterium]